MSDIRFTTAAILAGGLSRRMGFDKYKIQVGGKKLLDMLVDKLHQEFETLFIVANSDDIELPEGVILIRDDFPGQGPMAGIQAALKHADSDYVYVMACDMPQINLEYIRLMKTMLESRPAEACCFKNGTITEPFHAFYSKKAEPKIAELLRSGQRKAQAILDDLDCIAVEAEQLPHLMNVSCLFLNMKIGRASCRERV